MRRASVPAICAGSAFAPRFASFRIPSSVAAPSVPACGVVTSVISGMSPLDLRTYSAFSPSTSVPILPTTERTCFSSGDFRIGLLSSPLNVPVVPWKPM